MNIFKRYGPGRSANKKDQWTDRAAVRIAALLLIMQHRFARFMNKNIASLSPRRLKSVVIIFFLFSGGFSIYITVRSVFPGNAGMTDTGKISVPEHVTQSAEGVYKDAAVTRDEMVEQLQRYKRTMDSLGQPIRQGLLDSMKTIETIYHSQKDIK